MLQVSWWDKDLKRIVPPAAVQLDNPRYVHVTGVDVLSNDKVNLAAAAITTMVVGVWATTAGM